MFNAQIKLDLQELTERVDLMERQLRKLYKEVAMLKNPSNAPRSSARRVPRRNSHHNASYLLYGNDGRVDIQASAEAIGRTVHEIMEKTWPKNSAESRIDHAVRGATPGRGGMISREEWLRRNPEQMDLFR